MEKDISLLKVSKIVENRIKEKEEEINKLFFELSEVCLRDVMKESGLAAHELARCGGFELNSIISSQLRYMYLDQDLKVGFKVIGEAFNDK